MAWNNVSYLGPGELQVVIAQVRTLGSFIENSGIDMYGPQTVKQILDGNHVKRGEEAHMITLQARFTLYQTASRNA